MKFGTVKDLPVVSLADAGKLGYIDSALIQVDGSLVLGFRVRSGGLLTRYDAVLLADVKSIGSDAVTVEDRSKLNDQKKFSGLEGSRPLDEITGSRLMTEGGINVGTVGDIEFEPTSGRIDKYILSTNLLEKIRHIENNIPASAVHSMGQGIVVVADDAIAPPSPGGD